MATGIKHGTNQPRREKLEKVIILAQKFHNEFAKECGSPFYRELIGYDLTSPEELEKARKLNIFDKKCSHFVKKAVEILIDLE